MMRRLKAVIVTSAFPRYISSKLKSGGKFPYLTQETTLIQGVPTRRVLIRTQWDGYGADNVKRDIGEWYRVILWQEDVNYLQGQVTVEGSEKHSVQQDVKAKAVIVEVAVEADDKENGVIIVHSV